MHSVERYLKSVGCPNNAMQPVIYYVSSQIFALHFYKLKKMFNIINLVFTFIGISDYNDWLQVLQSIVAWVRQDLCML